MTAADLSSAPFPMTRMAARIRQERERMGLSVSDLARRAALAKSTLSQLEAGVGNPSIETLWALAMALEVPISRLIDAPQQATQVIYADEGIVLHAADALYQAVLLAPCTPHARRDVYRVLAQPGKPRLSQPHAPGTMEYVVVMHGRAWVGPQNARVLLKAGDYARYAADVLHVFDAVDADTKALVVIEYA
jgi:transcriptional regulator with XRE-family HTH domain